VVDGGKGRVRSAVRLYEGVYQHEASGDVVGEEAERRLGDRGGKAPAESPQTFVEQSVHSSLAQFGNKLHDRHRRALVSVLLDASFEPIPLIGGCF